MVADKAGRQGGPQRGRAGRGAVLAVALLAVATLLAGCAGAPAEERLRERIAAMESAIEAREVGPFMEGIAGNFIGEGGADQRQLRALLAAQTMRNAEIGVLLGPLDLSVEGDQARVAFKLVLTGGAGGLLPERAQAYDVDSRWLDGDDGWQVVTADWTPVGD